MKDHAEIVDLNQLTFPKFNSEQIEFFKGMIQILKNDRLQLDPRTVKPKYFQLQWNSLEAMEGTYRWLIDANFAVIQAEADERVGKEAYNPQKTIDLAGNQVLIDNASVNENNSTF